VPDADAAFLARFGRSPRPVQRVAVEVAQDRAGMVIVEAPIGEGKTEAALLAAEVLAARSGADGCFVARRRRHGDRGDDVLPAPAGMAASGIGYRGCRRPQTGPW
jgi:hypothetical protein